MMLPTAGVLAVFFHTNGDSFILIEGAFSIADPPLTIVVAAAAE
ncbi:MAG: hypothetical protein ACRELS_18430 [Candidatus Rokuibacteriota bacterium]